MGLKIIGVAVTDEEKKNPVHAVATIASDSVRHGIVELQGMDAKKLAIAAAKGILEDPRINDGDVFTYPVNAAGEKVSQGELIAGYHGEFKLIKKLV